MADKKISALSGATVPVAGTEVLPIVQSSTTVKIAIDDLLKKSANFTTISGANTAIATQTSADQIRAGSYSSGRSGIWFDVSNTTYSNREWYLENVGSTGNFYLGRKDANIATFYNGGDVGIDNGNLVQGTAAKGVNFTANTPAAGMTSQLLNWYEEGTWTPADVSGAGLSFSNVNAYYTRIGRMVYAYCRVTYPTTADTNAAAVGGLPFTIQNAQAARQANITYSSQTTATFLFPIPNDTYGIFFNAAGAVTNASMSGSDNWLMFIYPAA